MDRLYIDAQSFYEVIVLPAFQDLIPTNYPYQGTLSEFTIMDDVSSKRSIIDIRRQQNILQRRDASCEINYKKIFGTSNRTISVDEFYSATKLCRNELYQGCLRDWRQNKAAFEEKIQPYFQAAIMTDVATNSYFGDTARIVAPNAIWNTNTFDGIFKWIKMYYAAGVIPTTQSIAIADGTDYTATPTAAYTLLKGMYDKQNMILRSSLPKDKAFYVSQEIASGYEDYLIATGTTANGYVDIVNGIKTLAFKGIPIFVEPIFTPVITELKGSIGYAAVLTYRTNFIFATDKSYGEGPNGDEALRIFWSDDEMVWKWQFFMKAGTQIALPEHVIFALSSF